LIGFEDSFGKIVLAIGLAVDFQFVCFDVGWEGYSWAKATPT
jgi:hypothetical protein